MGHATHRYYSNLNQDYYYSDNAIFVAEIASTVNETLLSLYMLNNVDDVNEKKNIINEMLDDIKNTIYRSKIDDPIYRKSIFNKLDITYKEKEFKSVIDNCTDSVIII